MIDDIVLRKLAGRLLINLAYANERAQVMLCESFSFTPIKGQVALNPIPKSFKAQLQKDPSLLSHLKNIEYQVVP